MNKKAAELLDEFVEKKAKRVADRMTLTPGRHGVDRPIDSTVVVDKPWYRRNNPHNFKVLALSSLYKVDPESVKSLKEMDEESRKLKIIEIMENAAKEQKGLVSYRAPEPLLFGKRRFNEMANNPVKTNIYTSPDSYERIRKDVEDDYLYLQKSPKKLYEAIKNNDGRNIFFVPPTNKEKNASDVLDKKAASTLDELVLEKKASGFTDKQLQELLQDKSFPFSETETRYLLKKGHNKLMPIVDNTHANKLFKAKQDTPRERNVVIGASLGALGGAVGNKNVKGALLGAVGGAALGAPLGLLAGAKASEWKAKRKFGKNDEEFLKRFPGAVSADEARNRLSNVPGHIVLNQGIMDAYLNADDFMDEGAENQPNYQNKLDYFYSRVDGPSDAKKYMVGPNFREKKASEMLDELVLEKQAYTFKDVLIGTGALAGAGLGYRRYKKQEAAGKKNPAQIPVGAFSGAVAGSIANDLFELAPHMRQVPEALRYVKTLMKNDPAFRRGALGALAIGAPTGYFAGKLTEQIKDGATPEEAFRETFKKPAFLGASKKVSEKHAKEMGSVNNYRTASLNYEELVGKIAQEIMDHA